MNQRIGEAIGRPGDDRLERPGEIARRDLADLLQVTLLQRRHHLIQNRDRFATGGPLPFGPQQVLFGHHLENRSDVLRHPSVHQHQTALQRVARRGRDAIRAEHGVTRHQTPATDAELRVPCFGPSPLDQLDPRPDPSRVLPTAAAPADPLAEDGAGCDDPSIRFGQRSFEGTHLTGRTHQDRNQATEQVGRDRQTRPLGDVVDLTDEFQAEPRSDDGRQQRFDRLVASLEPRRDESRCDHRSLEQSGVVAGEVEHLGDRRHFGDRTEIDADQSEDRPIDDSQVTLDRRTNRSVSAAHAEIDRDVQDASPFGKVHPEKEDVAPGAVRKVHPDRSPFGEDRIRIPLAPLQQFGTDPQRMILGMPDAEHPAIARDAADTASHLIGERLEGELVVRLSQRAGRRFARAVSCLSLQKGVDRLGEAPFEQMMVTVERNSSVGRRRQRPRQVITVDRRQEEERAHPVVEVVAATPEAIESLDMRQQLVGRCVAADGIERTVADRRIVADDDLDQIDHDRSPPRTSSDRSASSSTSSVSTCSRSRPERASASCATSRPYFVPML